MAKGSSGFDKGGSKLPTLTGSEKQIKYAEDIRSAVMPIVNRFDLKDLKERINSETSSKWFIESSELKSALYINGKTGYDEINIYKNVIEKNMDIIREKMKGKTIRETRAALRPYGEMITKLENDYTDYLRRKHLEEDRNRRKKLK